MWPICVGPSPYCPIVNNTATTPGHPSGVRIRSVLAQARAQASEVAPGMVVVTALGAVAPVGLWDRVRPRLTLVVDSLSSLARPPVDRDGDGDLWDLEPAALAWVHASLRRAIVAAGGGALELARVRRLLDSHVADLRRLQVDGDPSAGHGQTLPLFFPLLELAGRGTPGWVSPERFLSLLFYVFAELAAVAFTARTQAPGAALLAAVAILLREAMSARGVCDPGAPGRHPYWIRPALDAPPLRGQLIPTGPPPPARTNPPRVLPAAALLPAG